MTRHENLIEPDAPGVRGGVGVLVGLFMLMWERVRDFVRRVNPRVRALTMIAFALLVLVWVATDLGRRALQYMEDMRGPFLYDALVAPYPLQTRPLPPPEAPAASLLPVTAGPYVLETTLLTNEEAVETADPAPGLLAQCFFSTQDPILADCGVAPDYRAYEAAMGVYRVPAPVVEEAASETAGGAAEVTDGSAVDAPEAAAVDDTTVEEAASETTGEAAEVANAGAAEVPASDGEVSEAAEAQPEEVVEEAPPAPPVYLVAARFRDEDRARQVLTELREYARTIGRTGNFVLDEAGAADFFESSTRGWFSFSWARGSWVFVASARGFDDLDSFMQMFPY